MRRCAVQEEVATNAAIERYSTRQPRQTFTDPRGSFTDAPAAAQPMGARKNWQRAKGVLKRVSLGPTVRASVSEDLPRGM